MKLAIVFVMETLDQEALQCNRTVVLKVMRAVDQSDVAPARSVQYRTPGSNVLTVGVSPRISSDKSHFVIR
jgi:hypothetical protein